MFIINQSKAWFWVLGQECFGDETEWGPTPNHNAPAYNYILDIIVCFQVCCNSLGEKALCCFNMTTTPVHNARSIKKWLSLFAVEELDCTEPWPQPQPHPTPLGRAGTPPTSVSNRTNALVAEWEQIPAASFHNLVERAEAVPADWTGHIRVVRVNLGKQPVSKAREREKSFKSPLKCEAICIMWVY